MLSFQHRDGLLDCTGPFSALLLRPITQQDGLLTTKGNKLQIACGSTWRKPRDDWKEKNKCFRFTGCDQTNCESEQLASHRPEPRYEQLMEDPNPGRIKFFTFSKNGIWSLTSRFLDFFGVAAAELTGPWNEFPLLS